jgi:hypothetical protein
MSLWSTLKSIAKVPLRTRWAARLAARSVAHGAKELCAPPDTRGLILVLNENRWQQDLVALVGTGRLHLMAANIRLISRLHDLFAKGKIQTPTEYFLESDSQVWAWRARRVTYLRHLVRSLRDEHGYAAVMTPAIHYATDIPWAEACEAEGIPFITVHKEFTVIDERQLHDKADLWRKRRFRYLGRWLCVNNENARTLFIEAGVAPPERISVCGLLRSDNIASPDSPYRRPPDPAKPCATLFSFGHLTGPFSTTDTRSHYFSRLANEGFVELFRHVHVAFAEMALARPDVSFRMKLKNTEKWWIDEIEAVLRADLGRGVADIPNLEIVNRWAPELIQESSFVVCLNSTVVLESRILGRNTILPVFAEAVDKYPNHVYFQRYLDQFAVATSKADLTDKMARALSGERLHPDRTPRLDEMFTYYLGGCDGRAAMRVADVVERAMAT